MSETSLRICIVEDDSMVRATLEEHCQRVWTDRTVKIVGCPDVPTAMVEILREAVDLIILDLGLPGISGVAALSLIHGYTPMTPIILSTGLIPNFDHGPQLGVQAVLLKPFTGDVFAKTLRRVIDERNAPKLPSAEDAVSKLLSGSLISYRLLYNIFLESDAAILVTDGDIILAVNKAAPFLFGYDVSELLGQSVDILVPTVHRPSHRANRLHFALEPRSREMGDRDTLEAQAKDGSTFPVSVSLSPFMEVGGLRVVVTIRRRVSPHL